MKQCLCGCKNPVFSHGYSKFCQYKRTDEKWLKTLNKKTTIAPISKRPLKMKRKSTGEKKLFESIWLKRPHICEKCNTPIQEPTVFNFHHVLRKGKYPELRLEESNIKILCYDCHYKIHNK